MAIEVFEFVVVANIWGVFSKILLEIILLLLITIVTRMAQLKNNISFENFMKI